MKKVVTRIAPSPTGQMHIGTVRTALFNYLFAKHHGGEYFVRIEDTDKERNKEEWVDAIWQDFEWCGLHPDAKYRTSERGERHRELLRRLVEKGDAYVSKEPAKDDPAKTVEVVRLHNPGTSVTFNDLIRGEVTFDTTELGDFVIARAIDDPLYHFAVVVDDGDAAVSHVLRAEEHISNTPRQILIQRALGFEEPLYGHLPLILAPDRSKLSKRKHGASIENYRAQGFLPEATINYLALLGWTPPSGKEILSLPEMVEAFDLAHVHKSGAVFDLTKYHWFNRQYLLALPEQDFDSHALETLESAMTERAVPFHQGIARRLMPIIKERIGTWGDLKTMCADGELDYFFADPQSDPALLPGKNSDAATASEHLQHVAALFDGVSVEAFVSADTIKEAVWDYASEKGRGAVLWPLRYALTGREKSPDPFVVASIVSKEATLRRIHAAVAQLNSVKS